MCRYAFKNYKTHFTCFKCRCVFRKAPPVDYFEQKGKSSLFKKLLNLSSYPKKLKEYEDENNVSLDDMYREYYKILGLCPNCKSDMSPLGYDFKAPKKNDTEAWDIIKILFENGYSFSGCGCYVGYTPPKKFHELKHWLIEHHNISEAELLLEKFDSKRKL